MGVKGLCTHEHSSLGLAMAPNQHLDARVPFGVTRCKHRPGLENTAGRPESRRHSVKSSTDPPKHGQDTGRSGSDREAKTGSTTRIVRYTRVGTANAICKRDLRGVVVCM